MRNLEAALERLYRLRTFGIKPGLDVMEAMLKRLGHPEQSFAAIHVAGTNGKGSVCAMVEAVLRAAGYRVGLYISPHLIRFNERIRVDGQQIEDAELADLFECIEPVGQAVAAKVREPTFFEFTTALAFEHFRRQGVRLAVIETGMGGRLDATNVLLPLASVITNIGLEHQAYLGNTITAIAGEKAGIIKKGRPVVCGPMIPEALDVISRVAQEQQSRLIRADEAVTVRRVAQNLDGQRVMIATVDEDLGTVNLSLLGRHQLENCATAVAALKVAAECGVAWPIDALRSGLTSARWAGRLQVLEKDPPVIVDGAHNPDGARVLARALGELLGRKPVGLIWGMCDDKDAAGFLRAISWARVQRVWCVPMKTERALKPSRLEEIAKAAGAQAVSSESLTEAFGAVREWARANEGGVCIAGSLLLAGEVLDWWAKGENQNGQT